MPIDPMTPQHQRVLRHLVTTFAAHRIRYQLTGGVAGNLYGSQWPLQDIDIEVAQADMPRVVHLFAPEIVRPFGPYSDDEFELYLLQLRIAGIDVDINQVEDAYLVRDGLRVALMTDLAQAEQVTWQGLQVSVQPLAQIIAYKTWLGRTTDVADLTTLQHRTRPAPPNDT